MLRRFLGGLLDDAGRGDDRAASPAIAHVPPPRAPTDSPSTPAPGLRKPPILRRRTVALIVVLGIAAILYGTFAPFGLQPDAHLTWRLNWHAPSSADTMANVLIYVPVGAFVRLLVRRRRSRWLAEWAYSLLIVTGLSYLSEVGQTVVATRVPTWTDVISNVAGAMIGIALAPTFQRMLRNLHAWLYRELRVRPMATGAAVTLICLWIYALVPFDFQPSPGHVARSMTVLRATSADDLWLLNAGQDGPIPPAQMVDKLAAGGAYALLAVMLLLAARESGRSPGASAWYAFSRSALQATVLEILQLFTISHAADPCDLLLAWVCAALGTGLAWEVVRHRPDVHRRPAAVLHALVVTVGLALLAWAAGSLLLGAGGRGAGRVCWLPMLGDFDRTWNDLLGSYATGLLQYALVAGLVILWCRAGGRPPTRALIIGAPVSGAVLAGIVTVMRGQTFDTAQVLLAMAAGVLASRVNRAVFRRQPGSAAGVTTR